MKHTLKRHAKRTKERIADMQLNGVGTFITLGIALWVMKSFDSTAKKEEEAIDFSHKEFETFRTRLLHMASWIALVFALVYFVVTIFLHFLVFVDTKRIWVSFLLMGTASFLILLCIFIIVAVNVNKEIIRHDSIEIIRLGKSKEINISQIAYYMDIKPGFFRFYDKEGKSLFIILYGTVGLHHFIDMIKKTDAQPISSFHSYYKLVKKIKEKNKAEKTWEKKGKARKEH